MKIHGLVALVVGVAFASPAVAEELDGFRSLVDAASSSNDLVAREAQGGAIAAVEPGGALPSEAMLAHEAKAAALWSGRIFHARGKSLDTRLREFRVTPATAIAPPKGWSLNDAKLIHDESGLECPASFTLPADDGERILALNAVTSYDQRGRDVSCNYGIEGDASVTIYASYFPTVTLEEHAAQALGAIRQNFAIKGELPVTIVTVEPKDGREVGPLPEALSGAFDVGDINGVPYKTSIWLAKTHGWHVKGRATYAQSDFLSELTAAILFGVNYVNIDMKNRVDPTAAGPEV